MLRIIRLFVLIAACAVEGRLAKADVPSPVTTQTANSPDVFDRFELETGTGILWKLGDGATPLSYTFLPQLITLKSPANAHWAMGGGELVLRSRYSLLLEPIVRGPEHYFVGVAASGCLEWWDAPRHLSIFFASGGGAGIMHSHGRTVRGGQGEDLNLNWLIYSGAKYRWRSGLSASAGLYFQHISNGGMDRVNPGVNALGPMFGLGWNY